MNELLYQLDQVTKSYLNRQILSIDRLDIQGGQILAIVGPSGSGKSTFLRLLNFLEPPTGGRIHFMGTTFDAAHPVPLVVRRRVTTVFQRPILLRRSVLANVRYGLHLRSRAGDSDRIENALAQVGLRDLAHQDARTLSGGESQRVSLARAMVLQPDVLLMDEPTANLDPYNVGLIEDIVRTLNQEQGTTIVLVTHNVFQARRLADRVAFLLDGRIVEVADAETFFESPKDPRTRAFVRGDMVY